MTGLARARAERVVAFDAVLGPVGGDGGGEVVVLALLIDETRTDAQGRPHPHRRLEPREFARKGARDSWHGVSLPSPSTIEPRRRSQWARNFSRWSIVEHVAGQVLGPRTRQAGCRERQRYVGHALGDVAVLERTGHHEELGRGAGPAQRYVTRLATQGLSAEDKDPLAGEALGQVHGAGVAVVEMTRLEVAPGH